MRCFLTCIFLLGVFLKVISNSPTVKEYADSLYRNGAYFEAAIEYEREFFYSLDVESRNAALYSQAQCYKSLGQYKKSLLTFQRISLFGMPSSKRDSIHYESALTAFLSSDFKQCNRYLVTLSKSSLDSSMQSKLDLIGALNSIMLGEMELSKSYATEYVKYTSNSPELDLEQVEELYRKRNLPKMKSEKTLFWLGLVPGFGQMYAGRTGEGITNSVLNLVAFSYGVFQVLNGFYLTGYFVGALSINKLYFGGRTRAENLLEDRNHNELVDFQAEIKNFLLE